MRPQAGVLGCLGLVAVALLVQSCASSLVTSAKQDDLKAFQNSLERAEKPLSNDAMVDVARAVLERELLSMPNDAAISRVNEVEACVPELEATFRELSERQDVVGAVATQVLLDEGLWQGDADSLVQRYATSTEPEWRAVAARSAVAAKHAEFRRAAFLDGDLRVRRAALRAARDARSREDQDALMEAGRLDPDSVARRFALEALSVTAEHETLERLRDAWPYADESVRRQIVFAWGREHAFANGGHAELAWVLSTQSGIPQLAAAVVLLAHSEQTAEHDAVAAEAVLVRGFTDGTADEQQFVARHAPRTPALVSAFADGLKSSNQQTAVSAASVLVRGAAWRKPANEKLTELLSSKAPTIAEQARDALAAVRAPHVKAGLRSRMSASDPSIRIAAATQLLAYHRMGERGLGVELLMADPDASVRTTVACEVIEQLAN
jgi:hypothetical protein